MNKTELIAARDEHLKAARTLAERAQAEGRQFTPDEVAEVNDHLAKGRVAAADLARLKSITETADETRRVLDGTDAKAAGLTLPSGRTYSRLARAVEAAVFGSVKAAPGGRRFWDENGDDFDDQLKANMRAARENALTSKAGLVQVPVLRRADGNTINLLPAAGAKVWPLFPAVQVERGRYEVVRQTSRSSIAANGTGGAGFVAKGGTKPRVPFTFSATQEDARTVAVRSEPVALQDLADYPDLRAAVASELVNQVVERLDWGALNGEEEGTAQPESFDGLYNVTGVLAQAFADDAFTTARSALTRLENAGVKPTVWLMHPDDWQAIELTKDTTNRPLSTALFSGLPARMLFGIPVITTIYATKGLPLLGDAQTVVAAIADDMTVDWSDAEGFATNELQFRAECRVGFEVIQPGSWATVELTEPAEG